MKNMNDSRREFLKSSIAGAAGMALARGGVEKIFAATAAASPWTNGMQINPDIDNLDVVRCVDPKMLTANMTNFSAVGQNTPVSKARVARNLDLMAVALVSKKKPGVSVDDAWKTIFRSSKPWAQTKVAIKVNCLNQSNAPRIAIIDKLCQVLNGFGVPFGNIIVYDAVKTAYPCYNQFVGKATEPKLPADLKIENGVGTVGGWGDTPVPGLTGTFPCAGFLLDNSIDILINVAVNKGQPTMQNMAFSTLCMKNHYGTFNLNSSAVQAVGHGNLTTTGTDFLVGINKHEAVIGGTPVRQQLCIVDSLVASLLGPQGNPDRVSNTLIMGTFAPAVDYLTITKIRKPWDARYYHEATTNRLLTDFGYAVPAATYDYISVDPETGVRFQENGRPGQAAQLTVSFPGGALKPSQVHFELDGATAPLRVEILDIQGRLVRMLEPPAGSGRHLVVSWDGRFTGGGTASPGTYAVRVTAGGFQKSAPLVLSK